MDDGTASASDLHSLIAGLDPEQAPGAKRFDPVGSTEVQEWMDRKYQELEKLARNYLQATTKDGIVRLQAAVELFSFAGYDEYEHRPWVKAFKARCIAEGWNTAEERQSGSGVGMSVSIRPEPVTVVSADGEFTPELAHDETAEDAARRITEEGTWRWFRNGSRAYVPAHAVRSVRVGR